MQQRGILWATAQLNRYTFFKKIKQIHKNLEKETKTLYNKEQRCLSDQTYVARTAAGASSLYPASRTVFITSNPSGLASNNAFRKRVI